MDGNSRDDWLWTVALHSRQCGSQGVPAFESGVLELPDSFDQLRVFSP